MLTKFQNVSYNAQNINKRYSVDITVTQYADNFAEKKFHLISPKLHSKIESTTNHSLVTQRTDDEISRISHLSISYNAMTSGW